MSVSHRSRPNQFRIKSAYNNTQREDKENKETKKERNLQLQRSLYDTITVETKMLRKDYIEKYEIFNKQLKIDLDKLQSQSHTLIHQYNQDQKLYKELQNKVEISDYQGETSGLDIQIINLKLNLKLMRSEIEKKNKEYNDLKNKIKDNQYDENEIGIIDKRIELLSNKIISHMIEQCDNPEYEQVDKLLKDLQQEHYDLKKEEINLQQINEKLEEQKLKLEENQKKMDKYYKSQLSSQQYLIIQFKNKIKNFKPNSIEQQHETKKTLAMNKINQQLVLKINQFQEMQNQENQRRQQIIQSIINQKDNEYMRPIPIVENVDDDISSEHENDNIDSQQINNNAHNAITESNKVLTVNKMSIRQSHMIQGLERSDSQLRLNYSRNMSNVPSYANLLNMQYETESEKLIRVYFNYVKYRLMKINVDDHQLQSFLDQVIESDLITLFSIKQILKTHPFSFDNEYVVDEFSRRILDNRLLENQMLIQHRKKNVIKKIIKYFGNYNNIQDKEKAYQEFQKVPNIQIYKIQIYSIHIIQFLSKSCEQLNIHFDFDSNIDPLELLGQLDDNLEHLYCLMSDYMNQYPKDDALKNVHLRKLVEQYKQKHNGTNHRGSMRIGQ